MCVAGLNVLTFAGGRFCGGWACLWFDTEVLHLMEGVGNAPFPYLFIYFLEETV